MAHIEKSEGGARSSAQPDFLNPAPSDSARRTQMGTQLDVEASAQANTQLCSTTVASWGELPATPAQWEVGNRIGPFLLKRLLGKGGMGVVWLAKQQFPLVRDVAIKVMLRDSDSALAEAYFETERQALARLSHRAVAQIYDAGKLPDGSLFFAMEYVPGVPLNSFLAERKSAPRLVAKLMMEVCKGIAHAHQRGLIHRDIKPGNILVLEVDGAAQAKVIDFGIAVSSSEEGKGGSYDVAGTACYMSPEQREPGHDGIDARVDVYALGAVLAESLYLIAGIKVSHDGSASTKWRDEITGSLTAQRRGRRRTDLAALAKMPNELRAIAIKALAHDRDARYDSAAAMADDLGRWLRAEPVLAMPRSKRYILHCFVRRNALASAAASLIALALLGGIVVALWQARIAQEQARIAEAASAQTSAINAFFVARLGEGFAAEQSAGMALLHKDWVQAALPKLDQELADAPKARALLRAQFGRALRQLGQFESAIETLTLAVRECDDAFGDSVETATALTALGASQRDANQVKPARATLERAIAMLDRFPVSDEVRSSRVSAMTTLLRVQSAEGDYAAALLTARRNISERAALYGPNSPRLAVDYNNLSSQLGRVGELAQAQLANDRAMQLLLLLPDPPLARIAMLEHATCALARMRAEYPRALIACKRAHAGVVKAMGPEHPDLIEIDALMAGIFLDLGQIDSARQLLNKSENKRAKTNNMALQSVRIAAGTKNWQAVISSTDHISAGSEVQDQLIVCYQTLARWMLLRSPQNMSKLESAATLLQARAQAPNTYRAHAAACLYIALRAASRDAEALAQKTQALAWLSKDMSSDAAEALWQNWVGS